MQSDRRMAPRLPIVVRAELCWGTGTLQTHSTDLSLGGMFVHTHVPLEVGTPLLVRFALWLGRAAAQIEAEARVARRVGSEGHCLAREIPGLGLRFVRFRAGEQQLRARLAAAAAAAVPPAPSTAARRPAAPAPAGGLPVAWSLRPPVHRPGWIVDLSPERVLVLASDEFVPQGSRLYVSGELPLYGGRHPVRLIGQVGRLRVTAAESAAQGRVLMELALENTSMELADLSRGVREALRDRPAEPPAESEAARASASPPRAPGLVEQLAAPGSGRTRPVEQPRGALDGLDRSIESAVLDLLRDPALLSGGRPEPPGQTGYVPAMRRLAENRIVSSGPRLSLPPRERHA